MRLRRRARYDTLQNEVRKRGHSWGRWIYLGIVAAFLVWVLDLFFGDMVYFHAEGLVLRDKVVLSTQYAAAVRNLEVEEGATVEKGARVATLRSQTVEEGIAKLSSDIAVILARNTQLRVRKRVIDAISPIVSQRLDLARKARKDSENRRGLYTVTRRHEILNNEIDGAATRAQITAERKAIARDLPELTGAVEAAKKALSRLRGIYNEGVMTSPVSGVVGELHVSRGSVVKTGEPLVEIFHGRPFVLAYVPEGALYEVREGDPIEIDVGFNTYKGIIRKVYPVTAQLPTEFREAFRRVPRAQVVRVEFVGDGPFPTLFARTKLSSPNILPTWADRAISDAYHYVSNALGTATD